ncbi:uncharacterized protein TrAtP1_012238 [Trichoderma atroviride]|uniref:uncharacterized protein n=1 Tax=Hypocrea atroviridis TaxID=63577 RepID=UPI003325540B|nr:hypothetical protein TrAtP1_012238 [Trichoderma atroviride]
MSVNSLQTATSPTCFLEQSANSSRSAPTKITLARATRRRVSSMKGLLPLTLSSTSSCSSLNSQLPDEALEQRVDDYFPELLARDLEISTPIFEAKSMTAGPPIPPTASSFNGHVDKPKVATVPFRPTFSPYQSAHLRVQALGSIQERHSMVSFLDQQESDRLHDMTSDSCSATETETSSIYSAEPPSFLVPHLSIHKRVSKLQLANEKPPSSNISPISRSEGSRHDSSWIEADSDAEDEYREEAGIYSTVLHLSPRPPTPPEFEASSGSISVGGSTHKYLHRKAHSVTGSSGIAPPPPGQHLSNSMAQTWRPNSTQYPGQMRYPDSPESLYLPMPQCTPSIPSLQSPQYPPESGLSRRTSNTSIKKRAGSHAAEAASTTYERATPEYNHFVSCIDTKQAPRYDGVYIRPSPPPSPLPSVQMWLNGSAQLFSLPFQSDELARVVPLPPNVMENLRVNTACFPDTMLDSSSLTIDTIRAYSRKARHPATDTSPLPSPQFPTTPSRQSLWRRVVKRGSQMPLKTRDPHAAGGANNLQSPSSSSLESPKPWASIKNIFGNCSDYICEALYCHIVAYNYISALVARFPAPMAPGRSCSPIELQGDDIPRKAASLLGLNEATTVTSAASVRSAKRNSFTQWGKDDGRSASPVGTFASQDMAIRNIQTELLRCIRRLIAAARLMSESGAAGEKVVEMDMEDADVLLLRSLCEIVRVNEEVAYIL